MAGRLREVFLDGKWIANTQYKELIESVTWEQATRKVGSLNTIALLTFHVNYYVAGILNVLKGGDLEIRDRFSFDMAPIASGEEWQALKAKFLSDAEALAQACESLPDAQWDKDFVDPKYGTYLRNIEAMIEHGYYHMGQVSLVRKMILEQEN